MGIDPALPAMGGLLLEGDLRERGNGQWESEASKVAMMLANNQGSDGASVAKGRPVVTRTQRRET
jgi:hypothetical protein